MNRKQSAVLGGLLLSLAEIDDDGALRYLLQVICAQAQGKLLSTLSDCLAELDKLTQEERPEVLAALATHFSLATPAPTALHVVSPVKSKTEPRPQPRHAALLPPGKTMAELAREAGISHQVLRQRLDRGLTLEDALTTPINTTRSNKREAK